MVHLDNGQIHHDDDSPQSLTISPTIPFELSEEDDFHVEDEAPVTVAPPLSSASGQPSPSGSWTLRLQDLLEATDDFDHDVPKANRTRVVPRGPPV